MPFTEDLTDFFDVGEFATTVIFKSGITTTNIDAIFFQTQERDGSAIVSYSFLDAPASTTSSFKKNDIVTVSGIDYRVLSKELTGTDGAINRFELTLDQVC